MATLSDLTSNLARVTGLPEATVFAYGRFAREGGKIEQKGRGRGAATMTVKDAANLLIAVAGTPVTREAPAAVRDFRNMTGLVYFARDDLEPTFKKWLQRVGLHRKTKHWFVEPTFGTFLEFLLVQAANGQLAHLLRGIPTTEIPPSLWRKWKKAGDWPAASVDELVEGGHIKTKPVKDVAIGEDVSLKVTFDRSLPQVDVEIQRMWDNVEDLLLIRFGPSTVHPSDLVDNAADFRATVTVTQNTLMALGLTVADVHIPFGLRRKPEYEKFFNARDWQEPIKFPAWEPD